MIISLSGRSQAGKDSIADVLVREHGFTKLSFAANLKAMCRWTFNLSKYQTDYQEGKAEKFKEPILFTKINMIDILNYMNTTHELKQYAEQIKQIEDKYVNKLQFSTPRELLQIVGTDICRAICPTYHLDIIEKRIKSAPNDNCVLVDARFANERELLKKYGATLILVRRPSLVSSDSHASENDLGNPSEYDIIIDNIATLETLQQLAKTLYQ